MAQQINLFSPFLQPPRRHFAAPAMARALLLLSAGLLVLGLWATLETRSLQQALASAGAAYSSEKERLMAAIARHPATPASEEALRQELAQARKQLDERQQLLTQLEPPGGQEDERSTLLTLIADSVPEQAWLSELRLLDGQLSLTGTTLEPQVLQPWLARLAQHPALAGQQLHALKVEHDDIRPGGAESWSFQIVSRRAGTGERP